jgi:amidase
MSVEPTRAGQHSDAAEVTRMRHPVRRSLSLITILTLLMALSAIAAPVTLGRGPTSTTVAGIDVDSTTIPELQALMDRHRLTSVQLTQFYLHRIKKLNPQLNAVITVNPTALADARAADQARRQGDDRPLLGIPILVKDNVNTTGMPNTAGSWSLAGSAPADADIVEQLKAAGAIIIGKANLSEWANFRSIPSSSGWSGIGGQTNMAYVLDRNPCGSSSGSGVGVSANLAVAAVGTETDGSIVCPSGANGVVGIKPTLGLLSGEGIIPISSEQDTAGPMARNVTDAAVLLGAMSVTPTDYTVFLEADALDGAVIGIWRDGTYISEGEVLDADVAAIMDDTVATLTAAGATVVEVDVAIEDAFGPEFDALLCEFKADLPAYFETYTGAGYPRTLQDVIDFNEANPDLEGPWGSEIFELAEATNGRDDACAAIRAEADAIAEAALTDALAGLDAIIAPTNGPAWLTDPIGGDLSDGSPFIGSSTPSAITGWANVTVPAGYVDEHLPIGVSFIGGAFSEAELLALAYAFEQLTMVRVPPSFLPTLD